VWGEKCSLVRDWLRTNATEVIFGFYVALGFLLVAISARIEFFCTLKELIDNWFILTAILVCATLSGAITYLIQRRVRGMQPSLSRDANRLTGNDLLSFVHVGSLGALGLILMPSTPTPIGFVYVVIFISMVMEVALNTYFGGFWRKGAQGEDATQNPKALELEHNEWTCIFNNLCLVTIVSTAGAILGYLGTPIKSSPAVISSAPNLNLLKISMDGFLIAYAVFGTPVVWLLRPIHVTMACIRKEIAKIRARDAADQMVD